MVVFVINDTDDGICWLVLMNRIWVMMKIILLILIGGKEVIRTNVPRRVVHDDVDCRTSSLSTMVTREAVESCAVIVNDIVVMRKFVVRFLMMMMMFLFLVITMWRTITVGHRHYQR